MQKKVSRTKAPSLKNKNANKLASINLKNLKTVLKQGYVEKQTEGVVFKWQTRYMVLTAEKIFFFNDNSKSHVIGCINLKLLTIEIREEKKKLTFDFVGESQNIIIKFASEKEKEEWLELLRNVINYHLKQRKLAIKTVAKEFYREKDIMTEKEFFSG